MRFLFVFMLVAATAFAGNVRQKRSDSAVKSNSDKVSPDGKKLDSHGWEDKTQARSLVAKFDRETRHRRDTDEAHKEDADDHLIVKPDSYKSDCKDGDEWKDQDCNKCHCGDNKKAVCTRMTCPDGKQLPLTENWEMFPLELKKRVWCC